MSEETIPQASDEDRRAQETLDEVVRSIVKPSLDEVLATIEKDNAPLRDALQGVRRQIDDATSATSKSICGELAELRYEAESQSRALQDLLIETRTANQEAFSATVARVAEAAEATQALCGQVAELRGALRTGSRIVQDIRSDLQRYQRSLWIVAGLVGLLTVANLVLAVIWHA